MEEYIGIIKLFAGNFAPRGFLLCNGQILSIQQYTALFSILGTNYGGNGQTTFALPDLRQKFPIGTNDTTGIGVQVGNKTVTIGNQNLPNLSLSLKVSNADSTTSIPASDTFLSIPGSTSGRDFIPTLGFSNAANPNLVTMNPQSVTLNSTNTPIDITPPSVALNYIICVEGIYPSRP